MNQKQNKICASSGQFILYLTSGTTTACILWSMSAWCTSAQRFLCKQHTSSWDRCRAAWVTAACSWAKGEGRRDQPAGEVLRCFVHYSSFCCSFFWKHTGKIESTASTPSTAREFQDTASPAVVSLYSVVPALMATKDGGATPVDQPEWVQASQSQQIIPKRK